MPHDTALIATIAVGLGLAFVFGWLATRVGLPALVGYLLAGVAVGPRTPGFTADVGLSGQLAEIGVILLMFGVGLHFSVRDLMNVRRVAVPGALVGMLALTLAGATLAALWGWPVGMAITFGLCICISSTVVVIRSFEQRNALDTGAGKLAVGWMIVEDLVMVLALVLLPALAPVMGGTGSGLAVRVADPLWLVLTVTLAKVVAFSALMYFVGRRTIPWFLWQVARTGSRELFTLSVLAAALGIAVGAAALFGVSFALGAFFAGLVISESDLSHQAAADALPMRDAFAVLFFVSVGMLFDPGILLRAPLKVLAVVTLVMLVKPAVAGLMLLRLRKPAHSAVQVGASLGEIGEFSFILAGLAISLGLLDEDGRSLILAGAILSISLNPLLFVAAPRVERWLGRRWQLIDAIEASSEIPVAMAGRHLRDHAIVVGYGRVGGTIGRALSQCGVPYAVVEQDRQLVDRLRDRGLCAVYGDAARPGILEQAAPAAARLLVVATPDPFQARQVVELARQANAHIDIVVRTHTSAEQAYFEQLGVGRVVMGEHELALGMAHYAVTSLGHGDDEADIIVERLRGADRSDRAARDVAGTTAV
jgi:CPA2 family monovalent cation:H+ antiporter-2